LPEAAERTAAHGSGPAKCAILKKRKKVKMIRFSAATIALVALTGSWAIAQDSTPKLEVFGGYSIMHTGTGGLNSSRLDADLRQNPGTLGIGSNFNGWNAEAQYNFDQWLGIVADFGGQYGSPFTARLKGVSGLPAMTEYSLVAGPVISYRAKARVTPFVHALFGWDRARLGASTIAGTSSPVTSFTSTYTSFAIVLGGGVDYKVSQHLALRLGQFDYFRTTLDLNSLYGGAFGPGTFQGLPTKEKNIRFSTGIVLRF
jgi:opacity protein-like surface antigen